jgi:hypothetical protein
MINLNLLDYGARGDGQTNDTQAFHAAFAAITAVGGGTVRVPAGRYIIAGLKPVSRLRLELDPGAVLVGSPRIEDYPATEVHHRDIMPYHVINADGCEDLTISGGKITGNGPVFWLPPDNPGGWKRDNNPYRPYPMVDLRRCRNLRLTGVHLDDSAGWTLFFYECDGVIVDGCVITADPTGPNTDGIDISGCRDVLIRSCRIQCGDDAIVAFPSVTRDCEGVIVDGCVIESLCVAFKAYNHSGLSGAVRDLSFSRCVVRGTNRVLGLYAHRGGQIERVTMTDIVADTDCCMVSNRPIHLDARPKADDTLQTPGYIRHVRVRGLHCRTDGRILMTAAGGANVSDVLLEDITLEYPHMADPSIVPNKPDYGSSQDSNLSFEARRFPAALVADGIEDLVVRDLKLRYAMHENRPWKVGPRRGNGYHEIFPSLTAPAAFHPWWIRGEADLCPVTMANRGPNGEAGIKA